MQNLERRVYSIWIINQMRENERDDKQYLDLLLCEI